jgi:YHS domain-containing protein
MYLRTVLKSNWLYLFINILFFCCNVILIILLLCHQYRPSLRPISSLVLDGLKSSLALDGYCPVTLVEKQQWVVGDHRWGATHRGSTYLFAGSEEQQRFLSDPDRYAPVICGNDIVQAMEKGQAIQGNREHGVFYNGHMFLFADEADLEKFSKNPAYYADQALEAILASTHTAQQLR